MRRGRLRLEDGSVFEGVAFGASEPVAGEVVFNTGMVGYPETLTDPSYAGQILVLTYPLVGNYGVPPFERDEFGLPRGFESDRIQIAGLVVWEHSELYSHARAARSLDDWLRSEDIPALAGVDTRAVTKRLRDKGTMLGAIEPTGLAEPIALADPNATDLVATVSVDEVIRYDCGVADAPTIVLLDCGAKASIPRSLLARGLNVVRVPHDHYFPAMDFDGLVISNGPGDPTMCGAAIRNVERALALDVPILGICLGNQLLALAAGAETYKLTFGHRSQNQPCVELLPTGERGPLRDHVAEPRLRGPGIRRCPTTGGTGSSTPTTARTKGSGISRKPLWSVQFHPEATPGPADSAFIFDDFSEVAAEGAAMRSDHAANGAGARQLGAQDRRGRRVRLLRQPGDQGAQGGGDPHRPHQSQHRHHPDLRASRGRGLLPAGHAGVRRAGHRAGAARRHPARFRRPDGAQLRCRARPARACSSSTASACSARRSRRSSTPRTASCSSARLGEIEVDVPRSRRRHQRRGGGRGRGARSATRCMARVAYALGGLGSGICRDESDLEKLARRAFAHTGQVLVEEYLEGWKEIEYEVVRDAYDNCITVCNMENLDPMGIHTGESHRGRTEPDPRQRRVPPAARGRDPGDPPPRHRRRVQHPVRASTRRHGDYRVIEVNARLSRSPRSPPRRPGTRWPSSPPSSLSAQSLTEIPNSVTRIDHGLLRAGARLHRRQGSALGPPEIPGRRASGSARR